MSFRLPVFVFCILALCAPGHASPIGFLTTGIAGSNTQIDAFHTSDWSFTTSATDAWIFGGGKFVMKDGPNTADNITLSLYQGASAAGTLLASVTYDNPAFGTVHGGNSQSYAPTLFPLNGGAGVPLLLNTTYFVALTSSAPDQQNKAYFIKGSDLTTIRDADGNPLPFNPTRDGATSETPEPSGLVLAFTGAGMIWLMRRRQSST